MKTFNPESQVEKVDFVIANIGNYRQISLATASADGMPWAVCVNFDIDKEFNIFWKSNKNSVHSQNINANPNVSILIFGEHKDYDFAFYSAGTVTEVGDEAKLQELIKIKYLDKGQEGKEVKDFLGESTSRIYLYEIKEAYICDKAHVKSEVDISKLKSVWKL